MLQIIVFIFDAIFCSFPIREVHFSCPVLFSVFCLFVSLYFLPFYAQKMDCPEVCLKHVVLSRFASPSPNFFMFYYTSFDVKTVYLKCNSLKLQSQIILKIVCLTLGKTDHMFCTKRPTYVHSCSQLYLPTATVMACYMNI